MSRADLIVGMFVALIAAAFALMYVSRQTTQARRTWCEQKQMTLSKALQVHERIHRELPGWLQAGPESASQDSWGVTILPWIGRNLSEDEQRGKMPVDVERRGIHADKGKSAGRPLYISDLVCPDDPRMNSGGERSGWLSYIVNAGKPDLPDPPAGEPADPLGTGVFLDYTRGPERMTLDFVRDHDGEQHTLLLSENIDAGLWSAREERQLGFLWDVPDAPVQILGINEQAAKSNGTIAFARPSSQHLKGVNAAFVDGQTKLLNESIDPLVFRRMMTSDRTTEPRPPGSGAAE